MFRKLDLVPTILIICCCLIGLYTLAFGLFIGYALCRPFYFDQDDIKKLKKDQTNQN